MTTTTKRTKRTRPPRETRRDLLEELAFLRGLERLALRRQGRAATPGERLGHCKSLLDLRGSRWETVHRYLELRRLRREGGAA